MKIAHDLGECLACEGSGIEDGDRDQKQGAMCSVCFGSGRIECPHCQEILRRAIGQIGLCQADGGQN